MNKQGIKEKKTLINMKDMAFYWAIILPIFCGLGDIATTIVSLLELCVLFYYIKSSRFWALSPIFYIYYSQLKIAGVVFFNIYLGLAALKLIIFDKFTIKKNIILGVFALVLYSGFVLMSHDEIWGGILFLTQSIISLGSLIKIKEDKEAYQEFKGVLVAICISAMLYGIFFQNIKGVYDETEGIIKYSGRYSGTKSDPNYMAFFYCLSFVIVLFKNFNYKILKWLLAVILFIAIAISGSITALAVYMVALLLYVLLAKEDNVYQKELGVGLIILAIIFFIYYIQSDLENVPVLNLFKGRLLEKIQYWLKDDLDGVTTGRTQYSQLYLEYLFKQNIFRILFGGYQLNAMGLKGEAFNVIRFAAHNTYVDVIMTCGLVGFAIFIILLFTNLINKVKKWQTNREMENLTDIAMSIISIIFIFGLSVFPSAEYMFFLFF